jgi:OmpA-OmpF porin, OOP family
MTYLRTGALAVAFLAVLASSHVAQAETTTRDVVRDMRGAPVTSPSGNCVRTRWDAGSDACAPEQVKEEVVQEEAKISTDDRVVYFAFNKSTLSPEARKKLDSLSVKIGTLKNVKEVHIVGYADRIGDVKYNEKLSKKRAEAVRDYLVHKGVNANATETRWVGKTKPSANCSAKLPHKKLIECLKTDRRAEVVVVYQEVK